MSLKGWDNIYDFDNASDMQKPGDVVIQPDEYNQWLRPNYSGPQIYDFDGKGDYSPSEWLKFLWQEKDPESESQNPSLSQDTPKPNQPPRRPSRMGYLSDQSPEPKEQPDNTEYEHGYEVSSHYETEKPGTFPDPFVEVVARNIMAEWVLEHNPIELDLNENIKVAWTVPELIAATSSFSVKNEPRCTASYKKVQRHLDRFSFHVVCGESWSDPAGHIVKMKFDRTGNALKAPKIRVFISCSCPFWRYWGSDYNAGQKGYLDKQQSNGAAPEASKKSNLICKHVAACGEHIKQLVLKKK